MAEQIVKQTFIPRVFTAVVTPFTEKNDIDYKSLENVIRHSIRYGVGVVIFGTTGESPTLKHDEKIEILSMLHDLDLDNEYVVIGVGGNDTSECILMVHDAVKFGFTNIMVTTPYYNKPAQEGVYRHFKTISESLYNLTKDGKMILYNVPARTNVNILPETVRRIRSECSNVVAIKEASGDVNQMIQIRQLVPDLTLYSGDDGLVVPVMSIGGYGVISVISNVCPEEVSAVVKMCVKHDYVSAMEEYLRLNNFIKLLFVEPNPTPIKYVLHKFGLISKPFVRLPLVELQSPTLIDAINKELQEYSDLGFA